MNQNESITDVIVEHGKDDIDIAYIVWFCVAVICFLFMYYY